MAEAGVPGYDLTAWFAAFVPAGTPKPIVDKLNAAFKAALADPKATETLLGAGIEPTSSTPGGAQGLRRRGDREVGQDRQGGGHRA